MKREFKLNTDGCSLENPGCIGGGILWDGDGVMVLAFAVPFGETSSMQAEAKSLLFGVQQRIQHGFVRLHMLVQILLNKVACPWKIWAEMEKIKGCMRFVARVTHCYREGNQVADALSKVGATTASRCFYALHTKLTGLARSAMRLDTLGLPSIRRLRVFS